MIALYSVQQIRTIEQAFLASHPGESLMQRAAEALARHLLARHGGARFHFLVGPGNNGGDALVAADWLSRHGIHVSLQLPAGMGTIEPIAEESLQRMRNSGITCIDINAPLPHADVIVDGLFGVGLTRPIEGVFADLIARANADSKPIVAIDIPSGLNADTGAVMGAAIEAEATVTFIGAKPGLYTGAGPECAGEIIVDTIGLDPSLFPPAEVALATASDVRPLVPRRGANAHKGSQGALAVIGGNAGMVGAPLLAARAGARMGAGKVLVGLLAGGLACDPAQLELMLRAPESLFDPPPDAMVFGPGAGTSDSARQLLKRAIGSDIPLLLDADALNLIAADAALAQTLCQRSASTVLTPHPAEAARLLGASTADVQRDRLDAARTLAARFQATIVLKGAGTVVAAPDKRPSINSSGNAALATAGTGDVLAGVIGALLARALNAFDAARLGVWLHGEAAERLTRERGGMEGILAGDIAKEAPLVLNALAAPA